jgi:hypothetical protein
MLRRVQDALYRLANPDERIDKRNPVQVVATTHSPFLLDLYREHPEHVVISEKTNGQASFVRLSERTDAKELLGDVGLGDLWYSGILGGVPLENVIVTVFSESPVDEAAVRTLLVPLIGPTSAAETGLAGIRPRAGGWNVIPRLLPAVLKRLYYHTLVEAIVVVVDSDDSMPHGAHAADSPGLSTLFASIAD